MSLMRLTTLGAACAAIAFGALGQEAAERFVPIGESPGVSNETSYIGRIVSLDPDRRTLTVETETGERHTLRVPADAQIWLDRSAAGRSNEVGTYADCRVGRRAEVAYREDDSVARWIKLEAS